MSPTDLAPSSDDSDLHRGLDRELDLASERPSVAMSETSRGPGLMVAAIVASSLALAGVITLVRGVDEPAPAADEEPERPERPEPEIARAVEPPPMAEPAAVAARAAPPPAVVSPVHPGSRSMIPPPPRVEPTPAAIATPTRSLPLRSEPRSMPAPVVESIERFELPAPRFDEPEPSATRPEATERSPDLHLEDDVQPASHSPSVPPASVPSPAVEPPPTTAESEQEPEPPHAFEPALPSSKPPPAPSAATPEPAPAQAAPLWAEPGSTAPH